MLLEIYIKALGKVLKNGPKSQKSWLRKFIFNYLKKAQTQKY